MFICSVSQINVYYMNRVRPKVQSQKLLSAVCAFPLDILTIKRQHVRLTLEPLKNASNQYSIFKAKFIKRPSLCLGRGTFVVLYFISQM